MFGCPGHPTAAHVSIFKTRSFFSVLLRVGVALGSLGVAEVAPVSKGLAGEGETGALAAESGRNSAEQSSSGLNKFISASGFVMICLISFEHRFLFFQIKNVLSICFFCFPCCNDLRFGGPGYFPCVPKRSNAPPFRYGTGAEKFPGGDL